MTSEPEADPASNFEDALKELESIVDGLERGEPELSAALRKYEQGVRLLARCHAVLDQAERSVALLAGVDAEGTPITTPFDEAAAADAEAKAPPAAKARPAPRPKKTPPGPGGGGAEGERFIPF